MIIKSACVRSVSTGQDLYQAGRYVMETAATFGLVLMNTMINNNQSNEHALQVNTSASLELVAH